MYMCVCGSESLHVRSVSGSMSSSSVSPWVRLGEGWGCSAGMAPRGALLVGVRRSACPACRLERLDEAQEVGSELRLGTRAPYQQSIRPEV